MRSKIENWLRQIPGLEQLQQERIGAMPGCAGAFYQGMRVVDSTADVLGNALVRQRMRWKIAVNGVSPVDVPVQTAPVLGMLQQVRMEGWHVAHVDEMQLPRWEAELTVEFTVSASEQIAEGGAGGA